MSNETTPQATPTEAPQVAPPEATKSERVAAVKAELAQEAKPADEVATEAEAPQEASPEAEAPQAEEPSKTSNWARLKELDKQNRELKARNKELAKLDEVAKGAKKNPKAALEALGLTEQDIWNVLMGDPNLLPQTEAKAEQAPQPDPEIIAVKRELEAMKQEQAKNAMTQQLNVEIQTVASITRSDPNRFALTNQLKQYPLVVEVAAELATKHNYPVNTEQDVNNLYAVAAQTVEQHLRQYYGEQYEQLEAVKPYITQPKAEKRTQATLTRSNPASDTPKWERLSKADRVQALLKEVKKG